MERKKITSIPDAFGSVTHYDEDGKLIGYSIPGIFGGTEHYAADGQQAGYSVDGILIL